MEVLKIKGQMPSKMMRLAKLRKAMLNAGPSKKSFKRDQDMWEGPRAEETEHVLMASESSLRENGGKSIAT